MIKVVGQVAAIIVMAVSSQAGCQSHSPKIQNQSQQDVSKFARCDDEQGRSLVHPCVTRKTDGSWIVWVKGIADCPAITVQPRDQVQCLNEQK